MLPFSQSNRCRRYSKDLGIVWGLRGVRGFGIQDRLYYFCSWGNNLLSYRSCDQAAVELFNPQKEKDGFWTLSAMKGFQSTAPVSQKWEPQVSLQLGMEPRFCWSHTTMQKRNARFMGPARETKQMEVWVCSPEMRTLPWELHTCNTETA